MKGELRDAILSALQSYIALENSNQSLMLNQQKLIKVLDKVVEQLGTKHTDKLFGLMKRDITNEIAVATTNTIMEKQRLVWSTYNNINTRFKEMKKELIELYFARARTTEDDVVGELVFLDGQLDQIFNIDEIEVTTDGTNKLAGGCPVTEYCSCESSISGAEGTNKSDYSATFIGGGSTMSGYPILPHFQVRSLAQTEQNRKLDTQLFTHIHAKDLWQVWLQ